jgi:hypothetical protein
MGARVTGAREVIRGRIRVDASRAVAKLREHQLVDLHHYSHELVRAAVASKATRIEVDYDADDVIVSWDGRLLAESTLTRLLDHVLTEADDREGQRLRLLAMGVNAALGLRPSFVDVFARNGDGAWGRARWTPAGLVDDAEPEWQAMGSAPGPGKMTVRVHVKRRLAWDVVRRAAVGGPPTEVSSLLGVVDELETPLMVRGSPRTRDASPVLLAVPLRIRRGVAARLRARLEVRTSGAAAPSITFVERGVVLARHQLDPAPLLPARPHWSLHLPLRVVVRAETLPTNASRSAIRQDAPLFEHVIDATQAAIVDAVAALVALVGGQGEVPTGVRVAEDAEPVALEDALGGIVSLVFASWHAGGELSDLATSLLDLPLLRDATGNPLSYRQLTGGRLGATKVYLHRGEPLPAALAPWLRDVVIASGRRVEAALTLFDHHDAAPLVKHAMAGLDRLNDFMAHAPTAVAVSPAPEHLMVEAFEVTDGPFAGLVGEVALRARGASRCVVHLFYEGRELAVQQLPSALAPLPADIALSWDGRLRVRMGFDGVEDDRTLRSAIWYALVVGANAVSDALERLGDLANLEPRLAEGMRRLVRAAVAVRLTAHARLDLPEDFARKLPADDPLREVRAWPCTEKGRFESLSSLAGLVAFRGALCVAGASASGKVAINDRPVLVADDALRPVIDAALGGPQVWVPYETALLSPAERETWPDVRDTALDTALDEALSDQGVRGTVAMSFRRPGAHGRVAIARDATLMTLHQRRLLRRDIIPRRYGAALVVVDDETVTPTPGWDAVAWSGKTWRVESVEKEFLVTVVAALEGHQDAIARVGAPVDAASLGTLGRRYVVESMLALGEELGGASDEGASELVHLAATALGVPLLRMLDEDGQPKWVSATEVLDAHGDATRIPVVSGPVDFPTFDWRPLVLEDEQERDVVGRWLARRVELAAGELGERRRLAAREAAKRRLLGLAEKNRFVLGALAPGDAPTGRAEGPEGSACVAVARPPTLDGACVFDVMFCGRPLFRDLRNELSLGLVGRISLDDPESFEDFSSLSPAGSSAARRLATAAAVDLVGARLEAPGESPLMDAAFVSLLRALFSASGATAIQRNALKQRLRTAKWPTVQGGRARLTLARRGKGELYVGRVRYASWRTAKRKGGLDGPVVYLPEGGVGDSLGEVLIELKLHRRDVSAALHALQMRRGAGVESDRPRLDGEPAHPALRCPLDAVGIHRGLIGELEIVEHEARLFVGDLSGPVREASARPGGPVRAAVWSDTIESAERDARIAKRIDKAADRLLLELAASLDGLPSFVRRHLRGRLGAALRDDREVEPAVEEAPVFEDSEGRWHSLAALEELLLQPRQRPVWATHGQPPFPPRSDGRVILRLDEQERDWLRPHVPLRNMTSVLERTMTGIVRRSAPPLERIALSAVEAAACRWTGSVDADGMTVEVGILSPGAAVDRGVRAHVRGRYLCTLDDGPGWPLVAAVDDSTLQANPYFDGPRRKSDGLACVARVRAEAKALIQRALKAPADAAASCWVDEAGIVGRLWLPRRFPSNPRVTLCTPVGQDETVLVELGVVAGLAQTLPVEGVLMASDDTQPWSRAAAAGLRAAVTMVDGGLDVAARDLARYRWSLALLGADLAEPPSALGLSVVSGAVERDEVSLDADAIRSELAAQSTIWFSSGRGDVDGEFPEREPAFVVLDGEDAGLLDVLETRALVPILRELGGRVVPVTEVSSERPPSATVADEHAASARQAELPDDEVLVDPWFSGLATRLRRWVGAGRSPAPATASLRESIEEAIATLHLHGAPVAAVGLSRVGRAVRFQPRHKRLVINRDHPAIVALIPASASLGGHARRLLLAAIVGELNAAHESVTPATEQDALLRLLAKRLS